MAHGGPDHPAAPAIRIVEEEPNMGTNVVVIGGGEVLLAGGMQAKQDKAMTFLDSSVRARMIGDCLKVGCIQTGLRAACGLANNI